MSLKHKVPQGYSPADENAGLAYAFRDDDIIKVGKYQTDSLPDSPLAAAPLIFQRFNQEWKNRALNLFTPAA